MEDCAKEYANAYTPGLGIAIMIPVPDMFLLLHIGSGHRSKGGFVCVHACVYACVRSVSVLSFSPSYLLKTKSVIFLCAHLVNKKARGSEAQGEFHVLLFKKSKSVIQNMCEMHNAPRGKASKDAATARVRPRIGRNNGRQIKTPKECMRGKARTQCMACVCVPPAPMSTPAPTPMITLVILVGVGTAVDGVVELLEPPGARAVLLGDAAARGHLPVECLGELLSEHFAFFGDGSSEICSFFFLN